MTKWLCLISVVFVFKAFAYYPGQMFFDEETPCQELENECGETYEEKYFSDDVPEDYTDPDWEEPDFT